METIKFAKMSGAGNDFIVIDNREGRLNQLETRLIRQWCTRRLAIGADGLMLLNSSQELDFEMAYYNADGSSAAMCGNGGRCIARFAVLVGAAEEKKAMNFQAPSGCYQAVVDNSQVDLKLIPPAVINQDVTLILPDASVTVDVTDTGVPHAVQLVEDIEQVAIEQLGPAIRYHKEFQPEGINANFVQIMDQHTLKIRTYERGVEAETLACGTGAAAAALVAAKRGLMQSPVQAETRSKVILEMTFALEGEKISSLRQKGEARLIYWGTIDQEAIAFHEL